MDVWTGRPMRDRSLRETRGIRRRLDGLTSNVIKREMEIVVGNTPSEIQAVMKVEMGLMVNSVEDEMVKITERDRREGVVNERKGKEDVGIFVNT